MNEFTARIKKGFFLLICLAFVLSAKAQTNPTYQLYVTNEVLVSPTVYQFDIFLLRTGSVPFELATVQFGLGFDTSIVNGGALTSSIVAGSSEMITAQIPSSTTLGTVAQTQNIGGIIYRFFNCAAKSAPGFGFGDTISNINSGCGHPGTRLATFRLTNSVAFKSGSHCNHVFSTSVGSGRTNTRVNAYVATQNVEITDPASNLGYNSTPTCDQNIVLNGCTTPSLATSQVNISCVPNNPTGSATVTPTGGSSPYTYLWTAGAQTTATATGLAAGTYTVTVTATGGCTVSTSVTITGSTVPPVVNCSGTNICSTSPNSGTVSVSASGGTAPYTYLWNNSTTAIVTLGSSKDNAIFEQNQGNSNGAGEFMYTGKLNNGFKSRALLQFDLSSIPAGAVITGASLTLHCSKVHGGPSNFSLQKITQDWGEGTSNAGDPGGQGAAATANDATWVDRFFTVSQWTAPGGDFSGTVSAAQSVNDTGSYTWSSAGIISDLQGWLNNPSGNFGWIARGQETTNGQAKRFDTKENVTSANRPSLSVTYIIGTGSSQSGLAAGTYCVTVTDASGCTATCCYTITSSDPIPVEAGPDATACVGGSAGITGTINGASTGFAGTWTTTGAGSFSPSSAWDGVNGVNYDVDPADGGTTVILTLTGPANGACPAQSSSLNLDVFVNPTITLGPVAPICQGATSFSIPYSATTGSPDSYFLDPAGNAYPGFAGDNGILPASPITATLSGTAPPGIYDFDLTVFNANGCFDYHGISLVVNAASAAITPSAGTITCTTASVNLVASGGGTYLWDNGSTNASRTVSASGTYTVTVTDGTSGCTATATAVIGSDITPPAAAITPSSGTLTCTTTSILLTASGGGTYLWDDNSTSATRTVSAAGTYTVTVTGANGCTASAQATIGSNTTPPSAAISPSSGTLTCTTTSILLTASGGGTYQWDNGSTNATRTVSAAGTYTVTVTDPANGCTTSAQATIGSNITPPPAAISPSSGTLTCTTTSILLTASGGGTYQWDNGSTNATRTVSAAGTYTVTVTDPANGCTTSAQATIGSNTTPPSAAITPSSGTLTCTTTSILLTASGGGTYQWDNGSTNATRTVSAAGTYTVTVTDPANGCTASAQATIGSNTTPPAAAITPSSGTLTCTTTSILLTASGGGTYLWDNGSTNATRTVSAAGTYTVTVTDATNGCTASAQATIGSNTTPPSAAISPSSGTLTCTTTSILLTASGGGTYLWDNGSTNATRTVAAAGTYTVTVTGANGCTASAQAVITANTTPPVAGITNNTGTTVLTCATTSISLTASGGGTYLWDNGSTNVSRTVSAAGTYTVTVTGANGCTASAQVTITGSTTPPAVTASASQSTICTGGSTTLTANGASTYSWQPGSLTGTTVSVSPVVNTTYTVTGTDASGCTATATVTVTIGANPIILSAMKTDATFGGPTGTAGVTYSPSNCTIMWSAPGNETTQYIQHKPAGTYTATVTHPGSGCVKVRSVTIN